MLYDFKDPRPDKAHGHSQYIPGQCLAPHETTDTINQIGRAHV